MGKVTSIEWATSSWNPWRGCTPVSPGCDNCYAARGMKRWGHDPHKIVRAKDATFCAPLKWKEPKRIFVCSWSDFFHPNVSYEWRLTAWEIMQKCPQHTFLILTKRIELIRESDFFQHTPVKENYWNLPNVWLGITVENQEQADKRIPLLLQIPAAKRFISVEPMLGPINLNRWMRETCTKCGGIGRTPNHPHLIAHRCDRCGGTGKVFNSRLSQVICGGESGPGARPMYPNWPRSLRDQCQAAGVPFLFKQWGAWRPNIDVKEDWCWGREIKNIGRDGVLARVGKKAAGRLLDGREWNEFPRGTL